MRRLYPVPFRLIQDERQFKKWQWITARVERSGSDNRPESYKLYVDTINCDEKPLSTDKQWRARRPWIARLPTFDNFDSAEDARQKTGITLATIRPKRILALEVKPAECPQWTDEEKAKLLQMQNQGNLFEQEAEAKELRLLKKVPYDFHYRYECASGTGIAEHRHKIVDWEAGALFWKVQRSHGKDWEGPFRAKLEQRLPEDDLMFLMGTIHRFPDQWLIVSLIYPPKRRPESQGSLF